MAQPNCKRSCAAPLAVGSMLLLALVGSHTAQAEGSRSSSHATRGTLVGRAIDPTADLAKLASTLRAFTVASITRSKLAGAQTPTRQCMCTMSFAMVTIKLVDAAGRPVSNATVRVRRVSKNTTRDVAEELPGMYSIADDMLRDSLHVDGELFEVMVRWKNRTRRAMVRVGTKDPAPTTPSGARGQSRPDCRCHVRRLSGPEQIVLR